MRIAHILIFLCAISGAVKAQSSAVGTPRGTRASNSHQSIMKKAQSLYSPVAVSLGKELKIEIEQGSSVSAGAAYDGSTYTVAITQGYLTHPRMTADILRMTLCHEVGHLFGGSPRRNIPLDWEGPIADDGFSFLSSEGQADYYATSVCFRKLAENTKPIPHVVPQFVKFKCTKHFPSKESEKSLCERSILASEAFLNLHQQTSIDIAKPDLSVTENLIRDSYPDRQCRLDTLVRGSLCPASDFLALDFVESGHNDCSASPELRRPACWYR